MNIAPSPSLTNTQTTTPTSASISMMKQSLNNMEQLGEDLAEMLAETAVHPGSTIDLRV